MAQNVSINKREPQPPVINILWPLISNSNSQQVVKCPKNNKATIIAGAVIGLGMIYWLIVV